MQAEMTGSEAIQAIVNKPAIQATTAVVIALGEADAGPRSSANTACPREVHRQRHGRPALKQPLLNWNASDKYVELLNFETEFTNILQTKTYELTEEKFPIIKN